MFIRHGRTSWNAEGRWQGHTDVPLDEVGEAQAKSLASRLRGKAIPAIVASDLKRAARTAAIVGAAIGVKPVFDARWRERDVGRFAGLTSDEVRARYSDTWSAWQSGKGLNPPGGEGHAAFYQRVVDCFVQIVAQHHGETVMVVSHGGVISQVVSHVIGVPEEGAGRRFALRGNTGITIVEVGEHGPLLTLLNDTGHLE